MEGIARIRGKTKKIARIGVRKRNSKVREKTVRVRVRQRKSDSDREIYK